LGQQIEAAIREEILTGVLKLGERFSLQTLAKKWNVSIMLVRDVEAAGFLEIAPRSGVFVATLD
jgi:DNA-binding GntR family transcriptional regulator